MISFDQQFNIPILGIDEAGRGPLCGPVVSCCAWWRQYPVCHRETSEAQAWRSSKDENNGLLHFVRNDTLGINDSKKLTPQKREKIFDQLMHLRKEGLIEWGVGIASAYEIDEMNILNATKLSMKRAFKRCQKPDEYKVLVDGNQKIPDVECLPVIQGDQLSFSIATASIIAKVFRDDIMNKIHVLYPDYGLEKHKGYGTAHHRNKMHELGLSIYHRHTFRY